MLYSDPDLGDTPVELTSEEGTPYRDSVFGGSFEVEGTIDQEDVATPIPRWVPYEPLSFDRDFVFSGTESEDNNHHSTSSTQVEFMDSSEESPEARLIAFANEKAVPELDMMEDDLGDVQVHPEEQAPTSAQHPTSTELASTSTKKKKPRILLGLESQNIIHLSDDDDDAATDGENGEHAVPVSSYATRARGRSGQREIRYNLKYHPMDDVTKPAQAARIKRQYGEESISSTDSPRSSPRPQSDSDSELTEIEDDPRKISGKGKKAVKFASTPASRRSSRLATQADVVYNSHVHPQDDDLIMLGVVPRKRAGFKIAEDDEQDEEADNSRGEMRNSPELPEMDFAFPAPSARKRTTKRSLPEVSILRYCEGFDVYDLEPGTRYFRHERDQYYGGIAPGTFRIYEEPIEVQAYNEANAPAQGIYEDHDKENDKPGEELNRPPSGIDAITITLARDLESSVTIGPDVEEAQDYAIEDQVMEHVGGYVSQVY